MVSVLVADQYPLVLAGLRRLLQDVGCEVVGEAVDGDQVVQLAANLQPDVTFIDANIPGIGGMEASRKLRRVCPEGNIIVLSVEVEGPLANALLQTGVDGILSKHSSLEDVTAAIDRVRSGRRYIGQDIAEGLVLASAEGRLTSPFDNLTKRELQVILMIINGQPNAMIAESLRISPRTVTTYRCRVMRKLGARTTSDLLRLAIQYRVGSFADGVLEQA